MNSLKDRYLKSGHSTCVVFESEIWKPHCLSPREIGPFENVLLFFFLFVDVSHTSPMYSKIVHELSKIDYHNLSDPNGVFEGENFM